MPPKYYKMWNFILYNCKGGEYDGSLSDIAKGIEWTENGKKYPARSTVQTMLNWFINQKMIIASGGGQGRSLVVKNWEKYQGGKGAAPEMQKKVQKKGPDPTISKVLGYYISTVDVEYTPSSMTRKFIYPKVRKWGVETITDAMDEFVRRCDSNPKYEESNRYKGADFWFRFLCDEQVKLAKRRKENNSDDRIPRIRRSKKPTTQQRGREGSARELLEVQ
jgi:hypothetical protein